LNGHNRSLQREFGAYLQAQLELHFSFPPRTMTAQ